MRILKRILIVVSLAGLLTTTVGPFATLAPAQTSCPENFIPSLNPITGQPGCLLEVPPSGGGSSGFVCPPGSEQFPPTTGFGRGFCFAPFIEVPPPANDNGIAHANPKALEGLDNQAEKSQGNAYGRSK
jgi:hypothetical protein